MNRIKKLLSAADRFQQRQPWLAVGVGTWKKFGDDQAGNLAALIAYYAFASIFPLLLVFVTVLELVLKNNQKLQAKLLNSALGQYPVIGDQLKPSVHGLSKTGVALVIGLVLTFFGARGVATALQNAMNTIWEVPFVRRPGFPWAILRSLGIIAVIGPGEIATITLSSVAGGTGHLLGGAFAYVATIALSLLLNIGLFWLGLRLATAPEVRTRELRLSAILAAIAWQILQLVGGYFIGHQLKSNSAYGVFGIVLGLLAWFYLQAQLTLYVAELNVVRTRRIWPRSMFPPPLTTADVRAYRMYAQAGQQRKEIDIEVSEVDDAPGPVAGPPREQDAVPDPAPPDPALAQPDPAGRPRGQWRASLRQYATRALQRFRRR
jgi:membrane protein